MNLENEPTVPTDKISKREAEKKIEKYKDELFKLQNVLYAEHKHSLLIVLQGMDASGKDGTIRHVFSSMNPMGVNVKAFKAPTAEETEHDFLWRVHPHVPARGMIEIFNRSHYEEILVPTVHKTLHKDKIEKRYDFINGFEKSLLENNTHILKFFLHISKKEQLERIKKRTTIPHKRWKYDAADKREANHWDTYAKVYERIFKRCSPEIPWLIVPADHKWYRNYFVAKTIVEKLKSLNMKYPNE